MSWATLLKFLSGFLPAFLKALFAGRAARGADVDQGAADQIADEAEADARLVKEAEDMRHASDTASDDANRDRLRRRL